MIDEFPPLKHTAYFNTAYVGLMPQALLQFRHAEDQRYFLEGDQYKLDAYATLKAKTEHVGNFFGASASETLLVSNFSEAIRFVLSFLPSNMRFLTLEEDYPSLTKAILEKGFEVVKIPVSGHLEKNIAEALEKESIDVLALSVVQYISGLEIDQEFLHFLKRKYPDLLIIGDGTQFLGTAPFSFAQSPFDIIAASGYKWLMAGFGNGVLFLSEQFLQIANKSYAQIQERYYVGHFNILASASLEKAITLIEERGFAQMLAQKTALTQILQAALDDLGLLLPWVAQRKKHSSIFAIPDQNNRFDRMTQNNISVAQRGGFIRVSIHFYNSQQDIETLIDFLKKETF